MSCHVEQRGCVWIITLDDGENRFSLPSLERINKALDAVLTQSAHYSANTADTEGRRAGSGAALVITGTGKFFSNGLDLQWMANNGEQAATRMNPPLLCPACCLSA